MFKSFNKYKLVYAHLWDTYGSSWPLRISYLLHFITRICKLIILPVAISLIISALSTQNYPKAMDAVGIFVIASLVIGLLVPVVRYVGMLGENKIYDISTANYFSLLVNADLDYFNSHLSGYLTAATRQYADSLLQLVRSLRDKYLTTILSIVFPLCVILWLDWVLGIIALGLSAVQAGYLLWASNAIDSHRTQARELYKRNSGLMADVISNILAVKSSAQELAYVKRIKEAASEEADAFGRRYTAQAKLIAVREFITVLFFMVLLWTTVQRMSDGHIDITIAVLVVTYTTTILTGIYSLSDDLDQHDDIIDKILPAFEILNRINVIKDPLKPKRFGKVKGDILLKNIGFSYGGSGRKIFNDFTLHVPSGQKLGIVGLSGAGKSTLTKLFLRFNDVDSGQVLIDGIDIKTVKQTDLRQNIAYVPQEPMLLHASVRENVLLGKSESSDAEVEEALRAAHALSFVTQLSEGMRSIVGERGVKLSGGQKQRIAIARAVLRDTPIIILDEATSALDSESEQIIKDSFAEILKNKTAIVIAHRLSTLSEMDRIIVIQKGRLIEDGTHDQLLAKDGTYARLWKRQQRLKKAN